MTRRSVLALITLVAALVGVSVAINAGASGGGTAYVPATPTLAAITNGATAAPWNLSQGDPGFAAYTSQSPGTVLPTYTPGGATANAEPNLAVYPGASSPPYPSGTVGTPGPLTGYCGTGANATAATGSPARQPAGTTLPFAPAYFPHIVRNRDGSLTGYFDYRPKDADEAIVAARSTDNGSTWTYQGEALEQNPGYCPNADVNDDGEGHPNVIAVGGVSRLYTLERAAGDSIGVGMLVHTLAPTASNPLNGVPATEQTGVDPDAFATGSVTVPFTGGSPATIPLSSPVGTGAEQLVAGEFVDLTQTPVPTAASVLNCTGVGAQSLTGCTTAAPGGITVASGDLIEQVIATIAGNLAKSGAATACNPGSSVPVATGAGALPCQVPAGPNATSGAAGLEGFAITVANASNLTMAIFNGDAPNRAYIDGVAVYCTQANAFPTTKIENCTTGPGGSSLTVNAGDPVTSDPIVPATATQTSGLVAPDGIVGVLPSYPGAPAGSTIVMYTEKVLNYYIAGYTGSATTFSANMSIPFTAFPSTGTAALGAGPTYTLAIGDATANTIVQETCSGLTTTSPAPNPPTYTLTGCNGGTVGHTITKNSYLGAPGADTVPAATLAQTAGSTSTNAQKLFKNNEDLTVLRVAYTNDGVTFSSAGLANDGVISGASNGASSYADINNPSQTASPANLNAYATPGTQLATEMRFVGSAGSIITNPDGSYGLFLSGAWGADGDSDAFNQIYYARSTDGQNWSIPVSVISTDYTFAASVAQATALAGGHNVPLGIGAYYSGRAYGPSVVQNPDGTLTMLFAGYRLPAPAGTVGGVYGSNLAAQYTVGATDPLLYRSILATTLTSSTSPAVTTNVALSSSSSTSPSGTPVGYTAVVTVPSPGAGTPTGTVQFVDGGAVLPGCGAVPLSGGAPDSATCSSTPTSAGTHPIVATYSGDANYAVSSDTLSHTVTAVAGGGGQASTTGSTTGTSSSSGVTHATGTVVPGSAGSVSVTSPGTVTVAWSAGGLTGGRDTVTITSVSHDDVTDLGGFAAGNSVVKITVLDPAGTPVTAFSHPLDLEFPDAPASVVPAYSSAGGAWTAIPACSTSSRLPDGWPDCWFRTAAGTLHILTLHATYFALLNKASRVTAALRLVYVVPSRIDLASGHAVLMNVRATLPGKLAAHLVSGGRTVASWHRLVTATSRTFALVLPERTRRAGHFTLRLIATAGKEIARASIAVRVVGSPGR